MGEIYFPTANELRDQFLADVELAAIDTGITVAPPVQPGSDWYLLGTAVANIALIGVANSAIADADSSVLSASGDALEQKRIEHGLPSVEPSGSTGKVKISTTGSVTIVEGQPLQLPNGLRAEVVSTWINPASGSEIDVQAIDTGSLTNFPGGAEVAFVSPPANLEEQAFVSFNEPLTGGTDTETDERKRKRILNALQNRPAGGNWSHVREIALNSLATVQDCFVYPALGGPASMKAVPVRKFDRDNLSFTRALNSAALEVVRSALHAKLSSPSEVVVQAVADQNLDVALQVTLPDSILSGGNGQGWLDAAPWPPLVGGDSGRVTVTTASGTSVTVTAVTATAPVANQTHLSWWSSNDRRFYTALIVAQSGGTGAWVLTTDVPLVDSTGAGPQAGDFVSPSARNMGAYGSKWLDMIEALGPAENTTDANRLPRAKRHPFVADESRSDLGSILYCEFADTFPEITDISQSYASATTPTVPASVTTAPNIFVPRHFALYKS